MYQKGIEGRWNGGRKKKKKKEFLWLGEHNQLCSINMIKLFISTERKENVESFVLSLGKQKAFIKNSKYYFW